MSEAGGSALIHPEQNQITTTALQGGFKADAGKARFDLFPPDILHEMIVAAVAASPAPYDDNLNDELILLSSSLTEFWETSSTQALHTAISRAMEVMSLDLGVTYADTLLRLGELYDLGASKYAARNWEKGMDWGRCYAAAMRHLVKFIKGERNDEIDGQHHMTSVMWCSVALLHFVSNPEKYSQFDTRNDIVVATNTGQK